MIKIISEPLEGGLVAEYIFEIDAAGEAVACVSRVLKNCTVLFSVDVKKEDIHKLDFKHKTEKK